VKSNNREEISVMKYEERNLKKAGKGEQRNMKKERREREEQGTNDI
jgi:hypothetical protein